MITSDQDAETAPYTKPSNSKLDAPLADEAVLCPSVVTTTVCSVFCRSTALQPMPHDAVGELIKPSTAVGVDLSTATENLPDLSDWALLMKTAVPVLFEKCYSPTIESIKLTVELECQHLISHIITLTGAV